MRAASSTLRAHRPGKGRAEVAARGGLLEQRPRRVGGVSRQRVDVEDPS
jgi:hypothetical protein